LCFCIRESDAELLFVVGVAFLALEAFFGSFEVCSDEAVFELSVAEKCSSVLVTLGNPVSKYRVTASRSQRCLFLGFGFEAHISISRHSSVLFIPEFLPLDYFPVTLDAWCTARNHFSSIVGFILFSGEV